MAQVLELSLLEAALNKDMQEVRRLVVLMLRVEQRILKEAFALIEQEIINDNV